MTGSIQLYHNRLMADSATWFPLDAYSDSIGPYDPLDLRSNETLCVSDREPSVHAKLITGYPNRTTWIVNGPQLLGSGYEVVQDLSFRAWRVNRVVSTSNVTSAEEHSFVETRAMQDLESVGYSGSLPLSRGIASCRGTRYGGLDYPQPFVGPA